MFQKEYLNINHAWTADKWSFTGCSLKTECFLSLRFSYGNHNITLLSLSNIFQKTSLPKMFGQAFSSLEKCFNI